MTACYLFRAPPTDFVYFDVLQFCCAFASEALLVVRDPDRDYEPSITEILLALHPFMASSRRESEWPGTRLFGHDAQVYRYRTSPELGRALTALRPALLDWVHPEAPEDLCFIRSNGRPILVTIAHEHEAYFLLDEEELASLTSNFPALLAALTPEFP